VAKKWSIIEDRDNPKQDISLNQVVKLGRIGCTTAEIAGFFGCSHDTIERHCREALDQGKAQCRVSIKRMLFIAAEERGSVPAMIWLSKNFCDMADNIKQSLDIKAPTEELIERAKQIIREIDDKTSEE
jgi:DNA-binding CsgD family transcriptional regulator